MTDAAPAREPLASLDLLFADGKLPAGIAALSDADREDLLSLVRNLYDAQFDELVATGPKMIDALPTLVRKAVQKMAGIK